MVIYQAVKPQEQVVDKILHVLNLPHNNSVQRIVMVAHVYGYKHRQVNHA